MRVDSRYYLNGRYRTLYFLLPIANGALYTAAFDFVYGVLDLPGFAPDYPDDSLVDLMLSILSLLNSLLHGVVAGCVVIPLNLLILGRIYRPNFFAFLIARWRHSEREVQPDLPFVGPLLLTLVGEVIATLGIVGFATWEAPHYSPNGTGILVLVILAYIFCVLPVLAHGERTQAEREASRTGVEEASA